MPNLIIDYGPLLDDIHGFSGETYPLCSMNSNISIYKKHKIHSLAQLSVKQLLLNIFHITSNSYMFQLISTEPSSR